MMRLWVLLIAGAIGGCVQMNCSGTCNSTINAMTTATVPVSTLPSLP